MPPGPASPAPVPRRAPSSDLLPTTTKNLFHKYELGRLLGCGAFAKVYHARDTHTGASVAVKCINKLRILSTNLSSNVKLEVSIMRRLNHQNIVRLIEVLATRTKIYFVMEFVKGGELFEKVAKGKMSEERSRRYFQELISAVGYCHSRGVYHRDLKPENLLVDENGNVKVSDFGLSAVADQIRPDGLFHTLCGTPAYVAPEVLIKKGYDGAKVDVWSCGVILFVLNAGYLPFNDPNLMQMYRKIYRGEYRIPKWTSPPLRHLLSRLLDTNPSTRITIEGILNHPWFTKGLKVEKLRSLTSFQSEVEHRMSQTESCCEDAQPDRELNAFDIISFSSGFDLSGLFDGKTERSRFVSEETVDRVLERVEGIGVREGMVVRRSKGRVAVEGRKGNLVAWVEVYRLLPGMVMVEVEKGKGEEDCWNSKFWLERLRLASEPTTPQDVVLAFSRGSVSVPVSPVSSETEIALIDSSSESDL